MYGAATHIARGFGLSCWGRQPGSAASLRSGRGRGDAGDSQLPEDVQQGAMPLWDAAGRDAGWKGRWLLQAVS